MIDAKIIENRKEACKTYIEQTKLLVTLSSLFIVAPAAVRGYLHGPSTALMIAAEVLFILSVFAGYVVLGSISGSQHNGDFDVYRPATMNSSRVQIIFYLGGIAIFVFLVATSNPIDPIIPR